MTPLAPPSPLHLTLLETMWTLRRLRLVRDQLHQDKIAIEERIRGGHDGDLATVHHIMQGEDDIVSGIIAKLWRSIGHDKPGGPHGA